MQSGRYGKDTLIRRIDKFFIDVLDKIVLHEKVNIKHDIDTNKGNITFAKPENWSSIARMAFWKVSSNVLPILITSPTLFMLLLNSLLTRLNFLRSQRGILTTT